MHGRVIGDARIVAAHEIVKAAERFEFHARRPDEQNVRFGEVLAQQQRRGVEIELDVALAVATRLHVFAKVL